MFLPTPYKINQRLFKNTLLIDCDGVCANFRGAYVDACNKVNGTDFKDSDAGPGNNFRRNLRLTAAQSASTWQELKKPGAVESMGVLPGAVEGVKLLMGAGRIVFLTSLVTDVPGWMAERVSWLKTHFSFILNRGRGMHPPEYMEDHVIFATEASKAGVPGQLFVDDKPSAVTGWVKRWGPLGGHGFLAKSYEPIDWEHISRVLTTSMIVDEVAAPLATGDGWCSIKREEQEDGNNG